MTEIQFDTLKELINIGIGKAAGILNQMAGSHVYLEVPEVKILSNEEFEQQNTFINTQKISAIKLTFEGKFSGTSALIFSKEDASKLVTILVGESPVIQDMDSLRIGALQEVGNIVLNGVMGCIGNILNEHINYIPPIYFEDIFSNQISREDKKVGTILFIRTRFIIKEKLIEGDIIIFFRSESFYYLLSAINSILEKNAG